MQWIWTVSAELKQLIFDCVLLMQIHAIILIKNINIRGRFQFSIRTNSVEIRSDFNRGLLSEISFTGRCLHQCRGLGRRYSQDKAPGTDSGPGTSRSLSSRRRCTRWTTGTAQSTGRCPDTRLVTSWSEIQRLLTPALFNAIKTQLNPGYFLPFPVSLWHKGVVPCMYSFFAWASYHAITTQCTDIVVLALRCVIMAPA